MRGTQETPNVDRLTLAEARIGNRKLATLLGVPPGRGLDLSSAIGGGTDAMWDALAIVGWLFERRTHPTASFDRWEAMTIEQLGATLGITPDEPADLAEQDELTPEEEMQADPTVPVP